jgi:signal peptidase II
MLRPGLLIAVLVFLLDQASKLMAMNHLEGAPGITLLPGFADFTLVHNRGAAFGMFSALPAGWREGLLIAVAVLACGVMLHWLRQVRGYGLTLALGMVLGGAVGNMLDRFRWGWVVDFIHLHWHDLSWPVFNVADSAITVGIALLIWDNLFSNNEGNTP